MRLAMQRYRDARRLQPRSMVVLHERFVQVKGRVQNQDVSFISGGTHLAALCHAPLLSRTIFTEPNTTVVSC